MKKLFSVHWTGIFTLRCTRCEKISQQQEEITAQIKRKKSSTVVIVVVQRNYAAHRSNLNQLMLVAFVISLCIQV